MTSGDLPFAVALFAAAATLVTLDVGLRRLARPGRGSERIAGWCNMAPSAEIRRAGVDPA